MSFTPGPWEIDPTGDMGDWAIGTPNRPIATVETDEWWSTEEEWTANAHLIAAAPDMYAALEAAARKMAVYERDFHLSKMHGGPLAKCDSCRSYIGMHIESAKAALAKARGEAS